MRRAAQDAGRDPDDVTVSMMGPVLVGRDEDEYSERLARAATERDTEPSDLEERLAKAGVPLGAGERLAQQFADLAQIGVDTYYLQWIPTDDLDGLDETYAAVRAAVSAL